VLLKSRLKQLFSNGLAKKLSFDNQSVSGTSNALMKKLVTLIIGIAD